MRGSAVLNSYAPRSRESSRLFNALTSAFRKHLDEVHPITAESPAHEPARKPSQRPSRPNAARSSTVAADRHLASILTNPLIDNVAGVSLIKRLDASLQIPGADAIDIFEELHAKYRLDLTLAIKCLDHFLTSIRHLSEDVRITIIREKHAGTRFLSWLCLDETHFAGVLLKQQYFHRRLVALLLAEGHDQCLWERLKLGIALYHDPKDPPNAAPVGSALSQKSLRWPSSLLADMIIAKLSPPPKGLNHDKVLDSGLQACIDGFRLQSFETVVRNAMLMPCWQIVGVSDRGTLRDTHRRREAFSVDGKKYARWLELVKAEAEQTGSFYWRLVFLRGHLNHPDYRDPATALKLLDSLCETGHVSERIAQFNKIRDAKFRHRWFYYFADCALYLEEGGQVAEASRYFSKIQTYFPEHKQQLHSIWGGKCGDDKRHEDAGNTDAMDMGGMLRSGIT